MISIIFAIAAHHDVYRIKAGSDNSCQVPYSYNVPIKRTIIFSYMPPDGNVVEDNKCKSEHITFDFISRPQKGRLFQAFFKAFYATGSYPPGKGVRLSAILEAKKDLSGRTEIKIIKVIRFTTVNIEFY